MRVSRLQALFNKVSPHNLSTPGVLHAWAQIRSGLGGGGGGDTFFSDRRQPRKSRKSQKSWWAGGGGGLQKGLQRHIPCQKDHYINE